MPTSVNGPTTNQTPRSARRRVVAAVASPRLPRLDGTAEPPRAETNRNEVRSAVRAVANGITSTSTDPNGGSPGVAPKTSTSPTPSGSTTPHRPANLATGATPDRHDHSRVVAIDGPAAAGKTTVARVLADRLGAMLFDTGTLYRAVTLAALRADAPFADGPALATLADDRHIDVTAPSTPDGRLYDVRLDGEDVTWPIRDPAVEAHVSQVSAHPEVRAALLPAQRRIADGGAVVMVGRDIGSVVVPDAGVKVFLAASLEERARRRYAELLDRGAPASLADVLADLRARDAIDSGRAVSPLTVAADATVVETDGKSVPQVIDELEALVRAAWSTRAGDGA